MTAVTGAIRPGASPSISAKSVITMRCTQLRRRRETPCVRCRDELDTVVADINTEGSAAGAGPVSFTRADLGLGDPPTARSLHWWSTRPKRRQRGALIESRYGQVELRDQLTGHSVDSSRFRGDQLFELDWCALPDRRRCSVGLQIGVVERLPLECCRFFTWRGRAQVLIHPVSSRKRMCLHEGRQHLLEGPPLADTGWPRAETADHRASGGSASAWKRSRYSRLNRLRPVANDPKIAQCASGGGEGSIVRHGRRRGRCVASVRKSFQRPGAGSVVSGWLSHRCWGLPLRRRGWRRPLGGGRTGEVLDRVLSSSTSTGAPVAAPASPVKDGGGLDGGLRAVSRSRAASAMSAGVRSDRLAAIASDDEPLLEDHDCGDARDSCRRLQQIHEPWPSIWVRGVDWLSAVFDDMCDLLPGMAPSAMKLITQAEVGRSPLW